MVAPSMAINPPPPREDKEAFTVNLFRNYELRTAFAPTERRRLPTTLVTGWLGSGKTTVMRHVLSNSRGLKIACAVNDFAELNIDAELVARASKQQNFQSDNNDNGIVELTNGCLCCTLGGELETQVWRMLDAAGKAGVRDESSGVDSQRHVEYLLIETSGLVDPTETVAALDKTFGKMARVRLDSVVCVVDAESASLGGGGDERLGRRYIRLGRSRNADRGQKRRLENFQTRCVGETTRRRGRGASEQNRPSCGRRRRRK